LTIRQQKKRFPYRPFNGKVFAPKGSQKILIGNKDYITLSAVDYLDIDVSTGTFCIRNMFTGNVMRLSDKGEVINLERRYLVLLLESIKDKFYEAEII